MVGCATQSNIQRGFCIPSNEKSNLLFFDHLQTYLREISIDMLASGRIIFSRFPCFGVVVVVVVVVAGVVVVVVVVQFSIKGKQLASISPKWFPKSFTIKASQKRIRYSHPKTPP